MNEPGTQDVAALLREQEHLRGELEGLKQRQLELEGQKNQKDGSGQEEQEKKLGEDKKEQKPLLKQRARNWTHAHPLGTALIVIGAIVVLIAGYLFWTYLQSYVDTDDAEVGGHIHQISSRVAGWVIAVHTDDNRHVSQGQILVELDPSDYDAALAQAQANLAQAIAALQAQSPNVPITQTTESTNVATAGLDVANAEAALTGAQQRYASSLADLKQAQANAENAATEEHRYRRLVDKEEVSRELYDERATAARAQEALVASRRALADAAQKAVKQQEDALGQARARYREAQGNQPRQVAVQHATVANRRAGVEAAQARVEQARLNLSYCKIAAPATGIVGSKTVEVGQQVSPGEELLAVTQTDDIWVTANFKETEIRNMRAGQSVTIHVDALDLDFDGFVRDLPGATGAQYSLLPPENATGNYVKVVQRLPVRIRFKPGQRGYERLRLGMSVEPKVWVK